jgi:hypothetical protein
MSAGWTVIVDIRTARCSLQQLPVSYPHRWAIPLSRTIVQHIANKQLLTSWLVSTAHQNRPLTLSIQLVEFRWDDSNQLRYRGKPIHHMKQVRKANTRRSAEALQGWTTEKTIACGTSLCSDSSSSTLREIGKPAK